MEVAGYVGAMVRGNPDGYDLTNGLRWGVGAAFPQRYSLGLRVTAEIWGERYFDDSVTAPAGLTGADGSSVPTTTRVIGPVVGVLGLTWQAPNGFFAGAAANWNFSMNSRDEATPLIPASFPSEPKDDKSLEFRIGFHPGTRRRLPSPIPGGVTPPGAVTPPGGVPPGGVTPPGAKPPGGAPPAGVTPPPAGVTPPPAGVKPPPAGVTPPPAGVKPPPGGVTPPPAGVTPPVANRPPTVTARCDPCRVMVGAPSTVTADAADPDGDALTYAWKAPTGSLANPASRQTVWTAPMTVGTVPVTVAVDDGKGGTASASVNIEVYQPTEKEYTFEDVHFDFDRNLLRADSRAELDKLVAAMKADSRMRIVVEGHACNIGTAEYNLALGERRANAVRTYLTSSGIAADRIQVTSFGEERPAFDNNAEDTRRLNRRVAFVVKLQIPEPEAR
jgi:outer membrane protein OmpA-like peptidoglycan-associated protein